MTVHANSCQIAAHRQGDEVMFDSPFLTPPPPFTTAPVWRVRYFIFNPPDTSLLTLCAQLHSTLIIHTPHHPLTDSQIIPPTQLPPSDIHPDDMQPGPRLWPSNDHEALSRGRNKRHLQRLRRIFRAKRKRRLWIYLTPLFQMHGFYVTRKNNCRKLQVLCGEWELLYL